MAIVRNSIKLSSGGGTEITVVANYSALPDPTTVSGEFYWAEANQGTSWLPGSLGGTYYNSGMYYSNGAAWQFMNVPYQATQAEVNTGTNDNKFVTPKTFTDASKWASKLDVSAGSNYRLVASDGSGNRGNVSAITGARALKSDANGVPTHFDTATEPSLTELAYIKGVTSSIQTQLDAKKNKLYTFNRQPASYTLVLTDADNKIVEMNVGSANNLTIPLNSTVAFPIGSEIPISQYGAGQTTIVATGGVTLRSANNWLKINAQYGAVSLVKVGTDEWYVWGNLNA